MGVSEDETLDISLLSIQHPLDSAVYVLDVHHVAAVLETSFFVASETSCDTSGVWNHQRGWWKSDVLLIVAQLKVPQQVCFGGEMLSFLCPWRKLAALDEFLDGFVGCDMSNPQSSVIGDHLLDGEKLIAELPIHFQAGHQSTEIWYHGGSAVWKSGIPYVSGVLSFFTLGLDCHPHNFVEETLWAGGMLTWERCCESPGGRSVLQPKHPTAGIKRLKDQRS